MKVSRKEWTRAVELVHTGESARVGAKREVWQATSYVIMQRITYGGTVFIPLRKSTSSSPELSGMDLLCLFSHLTCKTSSSTKRNSPLPMSLITLLLILFNYNFQSYIWLTTCSFWMLVLVCNKCPTVDTNSQVINTRTKLQACNCRPRRHISSQAAIQSIFAVTVTWSKRLTWDRPTKNWGQVLLYRWLGMVGLGKKYIYIIERNIMFRQLNKYRLLAFSSIILIGFTFSLPPNNN